MPSGGKPKVYNAVLVARVNSLYVGGETQAEIARRVGVSQKVVWNLMRRHRIVARVAAKRDQAGPKNAYWKGDKATYEAFHKRVEIARGRPSKCEVCDTINGKSTCFDWANLTGNYADVNDYKRMCRSCHRKYDNQRRREAQNAR